MYSLDECDYEYKSGISSHGVSAWWREYERTHYREYDVTGRFALKMISIIQHNEHRRTCTTFFCPECKKLDKLEQYYKERSYKHYVSKPIVD